MLLIAVLIVGATGEDVAAAYALREVPKHIGDVLKSPSTAKYAVKSVEPAQVSSAFVEPRYVVEGSVDSQNGFGAELRTGWKAVVHVDGVRPELLAVMVGDEDKGVFLADAAKRYRPAMVKRVRQDLEARRDNVRERAKKVPLKKRKLFVDRETRRLLADARKYGLKPGQVAEILGISSEALP